MPKFFYEPIPLYQSCFCWFVESLFLYESDLLSTTTCLSLAQCLLCWHLVCVFYIIIICLIHTWTKTINSTLFVFPLLMCYCPGGGGVGLGCCCCCFWRGGGYTDTDFTRNLQTRQFVFLYPVRWCTIVCFFWRNFLNFVSYNVHKKKNSNISIHYCLRLNRIASFSVSVISTYSPLQNVWTPNSHTRQNFKLFALQDPSI